MKILIILTQFFYLNSYATEVVFNHTTPQNINLIITQVQPQSHYLSPFATHVFDLISEKRTTHTLVCGEKFSHKHTKQSSYLIFNNIANIPVKNFEFEGHQLCAEFATYIEDVFEFIVEENPIHIILNTKKFFVEKIILPKLDPYMNELPTKKDPRLLISGN